MDTKKMNKILALDEMPLKGYLKEIFQKKYDRVVDEDGFLYAEGEIPVLLVAHLDTVHKSLAIPICWSEDKRYIMSPNGIGGDDRCGVWMILEVIENIKCHVLFCEEEESGCVGAGKFCKSGIIPDINYIIEFDRRGDNDSVFYDCDNKHFETFINSVGFKTQWGSCSDISKIAPHLGIAAVNLSSGYFEPHTLHEYIDMQYVSMNVERVKELITSDHETKYPYVKKRYYGTTYYGGRYNDNYNKGAAANTNNSKNVGRAADTDIFEQKLLMFIDPALYWYYESEWPDCPDGRYYIDAQLRPYVEIGGTIRELDIDLKIYGKETCYPIEWCTTKAKMCKVAISDKPI